MGYELNGEEAGLEKSVCRTVGWNTAHRRYKCRDGMLVEVPCRTTAYVTGKDKTMTLPSNTIRHARDVQKRL